LASVLGLLALAGGRSIADRRDSETGPIFRYERPIRFAGTDEAIVAVLLDSEVYAATQEGFADIRVLDRTGRDVPYLLEKVTVEREETHRQPVKARVGTLQQKPGNRIEIEVRLEETASGADGFTVITRQRDFERTVTVLGSRDGQSWQTLVPSAVIFDYSRYIDLSHHEVSLPKNDCRYFRLVVDEVTTDRASPRTALTRHFREDKEVARTERTEVQRETFRIDRLEFWRTVVERRKAGEKKTRYDPLDWEEIPADRDAQKTILEVSTRREPLTGLLIETASRNFSRRVEVHIPVSRGAKTRWIKIGSGRVSRIQFRDFRREQLRVTFPETRQPRYRVVIDNQDSPPLDITGITGEGNVYRVVFLADPGNRYRLTYGSSTAKAPRYDVAAVLGPLKTIGEPVVLELGLPTSSAEPAAAEPALRFRDLLNSGPLLATVVVVLAGALGWALYWAFRRIESLPPD